MSATTPLRVVSWNLYHGRDFPPDRSLRTWRSRLLGTTERGRTHEQVNRPQLDAFVTVLERDRWDVLLLQEAPPRWFGKLQDALGAAGAITVTSRNSCSRLRGWLADRNPDLMGPQEGGSNQLLVRAPWRIADTHEATLRIAFERRRALYALIEGPGSPLVVANLHASFHNRSAAEKEVRTAAELAVRWANGLPLVFGGDLNLRPATSPALFSELAARWALTGPTPTPAIDHLLVSGFGEAGATRALPASWRELPGSEGLLIRLSDHPAIERQLAPPPR